MSKKKNKSKNQSWRDDPKKLFSFRIQHMGIGDALINESGSWRVDCLRDSSSTTGVTYAIYREGQFALDRKRPATVVKYLVAQKAPFDLVLHPDQALFAVSGIQHFRTFGVKGVFDQLSVSEYSVDVIFNLLYKDQYDNISVFPSLVLGKTPMRRQLYLFPLPAVGLLHTPKDILDSLI